MTSSSIALGELASYTGLAAMNRDCTLAAASLFCACQPSDEEGCDSLLQMLTTILHMADHIPCGCHMVA